MKSKRRELEILNYKKMFEEIIPEFRQNKILFHLSLSVKKISFDLLEFGGFEINKEQNHAWMLHKNYNIVIEIWYKEEETEKILSEV